MKCLALSRNFLGIALLCGSIGVGAASGSPAIGSGTAVPDLDTSGKLLRIGVEADSAPSYFVNRFGQIDGLDYQIGKVLATKLGMPVEFVEDDHEELPRLLRAGKVALIMGRFVSEESIHGVIWSRGYLDFGLCLIVHQDSFLRSYRQLRNRKVAIYDDPAAERWVLANIPGVKVKKFVSSSVAFEAVQRRQVAALIYEYPLAVSQIKRYPRTRIVQFNLNESHYAIGIAESNTSLKSRVDYALAEMMASADYDNWVGTYLSYTPSSAVTSLVVEYEPLEHEGEPELAEVSPQSDTGRSDYDGDLLEKAAMVAEEAETLSEDAEISSVGAETASGDAESESREAGYRSYVVKEGDTLARVATQELGSIYRWQEIWDLNRSELANPHELMVGTTLRLPP